MCLESDRFRKRRDSKKDVLRLATSKLPPVTVQTLQAASHTAQSLTLVKRNSSHVSELDWAQTLGIQTTGHRRFVAWEHSFALRWIAAPAPSSYYRQRVSTLVQYQLQPAEELIRDKHVASSSSLSRCGTVACTKPARAPYAAAYVSASIDRCAPVGLSDLESYCADLLSSAILWSPM